MSQETASPQPGTTSYRRVAGPGINMPVQEVMKNVAMYADLRNDPNAFVNKDTGERLPIKWVISAGHKAAPAGIATPHSFHMSFIESAAGDSPVIHAHAYREIFMPIKGRYRIYFNRNSEDFVELGPYDTFSVPPMLWRRVEQLGEKGTRGMILVMYDDVDDPNQGLFVPQEIIDADKARGVDPYAPPAPTGASS